VLVTKREKRVCKSCEEQGVVSAPLPPRIIEKCLASDQIVIDTVVSKYCDHTPLYRQSAILERDTGLELSRATLDGWVLKVGELLIPMASTMRQELLRGTYIQADETPVDVQMHEGRGKNHQAYLWQYSRPGGTVVFDFRLGRGRDGPEQFLGQFEGLLQTDGYAAYDQIGGPKIVHAGCWSHVERYFSEAVQLNPQDPVASAIVARIDELFAIDAEARCRGLNVEARHVMRQEQSRPLLDVIQKQIEAARHGTAWGCTVQGLQLHAYPVGQAQALPGISRTGVEQQPGGELDASRSSRSKELDPHRKLAGGTEDRSDSFGGGELP
jgi:transposase